MDDNKLLKLIGQLQFVRDYECKTDSEVKAMCEAIRILSESPAQPQRMHGRWEEKNVCDDKNVIEEWQSARCSVCGKYHTTPYTYYFDDFSYCPHCGADMRGDENERHDLQTGGD